MKRFTLTVAAVAGASLIATQASAALSISNASFENFTDDTTTSSNNNRDLITDWFERLHATDGASNSDETAEQVLIEGGNRPDTAAGDYWGHFLDRENSAGLANSQIYQNLGTLGGGDETLYTLTAVLGDRSNRNFSALTIAFYSVSSGDAGTGADGTEFTAAFTTESLLDSESTGDPFSGNDGDGNDSSPLQTSIYTSKTFNLSGASLGDEIWLVITQDQAESNLDNHSLIDDLVLTPIPEPASLALLGLGGLCMLGGRRR